MASPLLKPRWLVGHLLVVMFSVLFVVLGFWQLHRNHEQRTNTSIIELAQSAPVTSLDGFDIGDEPLFGLLFQRVSATGTYDYSRKLERRPRSINGRIGFDAVTPLVTPYRTILVNRGFVPDENAPLATQIYSGEITVTGWLRSTEGTSSLGPQNAVEGVLTTIARIDTDRLAPQFEEGLAHFYLDLIADSPPAGGVPTVLPEALSVSTPPHMLYAIQWFAFAAIASVGWILYLRKQIFSGKK